MDNNRSNAVANGIQEALSSLDHIQLGCSDLEGGITRVQALCGTRAALGGVHPGRGTCNALVSLTRRQYLEIYAPDPSQPSADNAIVRELRTLRNPSVVGWAISTNDAVGLKRRIERAGFAASVGAGSRARSDGSLLRWRIVRIVSAPSMCPFAIEWLGGTQHPSEDAPVAGIATKLVVCSPRPKQLQDVLLTLGVVAEVELASKVALRLSLRTQSGLIEIS